MKKSLFYIAFILITMVSIFAQESQLNYSKILSGIWYTTKEPNRLSSNHFSWGTSKTVPNGTYEFDLLTDKKILTIPGFGIFNVISITPTEPGLVRVTFYFNRGDFNASVIIKIIREDEIKIIEFENLEINILSTPSYYKIDGPKLASLNDSRVRIRKEPNLDSETIGHLDKDQNVYVLEKTQKKIKIGEMESVWYKIKTFNGVEGWAYGFFINLNNNIAEIIYETGDIPIVRRIDEDMISNVNIIYRSESDAILNLDEIEPDQIITDILDKPIRNKNIRILSEYSSNSRFRNIEKILELFEIIVLPSDIEKINNLGYYRSFIIKTSNFRLRVTKEYNQIFRLFIFEYSNNSASYDYLLKVGVDKNYIKENLGLPTSQSSERNIWVYDSFKSLRQINIFFEENIVQKIQLVSWGGI